MKQISLFTLNTEAIKITHNLLTEAVLEANKFQPCGKYDMRRMGFSLNLDDTYVSDQRGDLLLTITEQEKKIEAYAIKTRIKEFEESYAWSFDGELPTKKMIEEETHKIVEELLPLTSPKEPKKYKMLLRKDGTVLVEASGKKAEDLLNLVRKAIESFPVTPYEPSSSVGDLLDELVRENKDESLVLGTKANLVNVEGLKISITNGEIYESEATRILEEGGFVTSAQLIFDGFCIFSLKDDLTLNSIKYDSQLYLKEDPLGSEFLQLNEILKVIDCILGRLKGN